MAPSSRASPWSIPKQRRSRWAASVRTVVIVPFLGRRMNIVPVARSERASPHGPDAA